MCFRSETILGTDTNLPQRSATDSRLDTVVVDITLGHAIREVRLAHNTPLIAQEARKVSDHDEHFSTDEIVI